MYFFYLDESGNTGAHVNRAEPVHWLVAVAAPVARLHAIEAEMLALAVRFFGERAKEPDFEFHGADVFSGRRECRGVSPGARVALYREIAGLLPKHGCAVFVRGIDKEKHHARAERNRYDAVHPHTLAFQFLVERMDLWLQKQQPRRTAAQPVLGLVIADEQKEVGRDLVRNFARWRDMGTEIGYRRRTIRYMVDTVHYVPSTDSWLLQLADCVSYLRNRYGKVTRGRRSEDGEMGAADREVVSLWETYCRPMLACDGVWP